MKYEELIKDLVLSDERYIVMTAENRAAIRNIAEHIGHRFIDVGIAEQTLVGVSAGLALRGRIPIVHALSAFLTMRAFEFIRTDIGTANLPVKLVGYVPGFLSEANGPTHQAIEDIALMRTIPSMNVFCPADEEDMLTGLEIIFTSPDPFYIRFNALPSCIKHSDSFQVGKAEIVSDGYDVALLTYGTLFREAFVTKTILEAEGFSVRLINMRTLKPVDEKVILATATSIPLLITIEDHFLSGGLYTIVAELLLKHQISCRVMPFGLAGRWFRPALLPHVIEYEGLTGEKMAQIIIKELFGHA